MATAKESTFVEVSGCQGIIGDFGSFDQVLFIVDSTSGATFIGESAFSGGGAPEVRFDEASDKVEFDSDGDGTEDIDFLMDAVDTVDQSDSSDFMLTTLDVTLP